MTGVNGAAADAGRVVRVLLAHDQPMLRSGLRMALAGADGVTVVGEAGDGVETVDLSRRLLPDVVLMDLRLPRLDGAGVTRAIVGSGLPVRVLILTTYDTDEHVTGAVAAGAMGYLCKDVPAAGTAADPLRVLVARPTADLTQSVHLLRTTLLITFPLLVALLALVAWRVMGATLRPVEALRAGAEEITGGARSDRLPVPDSRDEIHRLAVTLNDMLHRLDTARVRQRAFVADAAHELRSPLTNMRTELEVAQRLPDTTDWPALAHDLLTDVDRLSRLVDDLLLLARADDGSTRVPARRAETVELGRLLGEVAARYPAVRYERPAAPLRTRGERDAIGRVVANLLDNAVRHAASSVRLTVVADGADQMISVSDDGPGIPVGDRERVFDRFTRLDDARARDAGGSGLGLAIVRELVRRHGGTVGLRDAAPPPGLRVDVRLPTE